jgi:hypothetical protein
VKGKLDDDEFHYLFPTPDRQPCPPFSLSPYLPRRLPLARARLHRPPESTVILGAAGVVEPIPAVIAGATGFFQVLKVTDSERRFETASAAARELRGLDSHWDYLSDFDHQMRDSIVRMVRTCEQLALQFATTSTIQVDKAEIGMKVESAKGPLAFGKLPLGRQREWLSPKDRSVPLGGRCGGSGGW